MEQYDEFFISNIIKLKIGRKRIRVASLSEAKNMFTDYVAINGRVEKNDGDLLCGDEFIAKFSINGRLWSSDEEEIILN